MWLQGQETGPHKPRWITLYVIRGFNLDAIYFPLPRKNDSDFLLIQRNNSFTGVKEIT